MSVLYLSTTRKIYCSICLLLGLLIWKCRRIYWNYKTWICRSQRKCQNKGGNRKWVILLVKWRQKLCQRNLCWTLRIAANCNSCSISINLFPISRNLQQRITSIDAFTLIQKSPAWEELVGLSVYALLYHKT